MVPPAFFKDSLLFVASWVTSAVKCLVLEHGPVNTKAKLVVFKADWADPEATMSDPNTIKRATSYIGYTM